MKEEILMAAVPTLLFPFARRVISDVTGDGGYTPLMLDPIDFKLLYHNSKDTGDAADAWQLAPSAH